VAPLALYLLYLDLLLHVPGKIGDIGMATGAGILAMNRVGETPDRNFVTMTPQAGGRVDGHSLFGPRWAGPGRKQHEKRQQTSEDRLHDRFPLQL
jgi:hypothetical protein